MAVHKFGTATPAKRVAHAHAANENASGNLAFLDAHRGGAVDADVQASKGPLPGTVFAHDQWTLWMEHWPKPRKMGYRFIVKTGGKSTRALTKAELDRPINRWNSAAFARLREGKSVGSRGPKHLDQYVAHARSVNVQVLPEFKNANNTARPKVAARVVAIFKAHNMALWPMVLADRRNVTGMIAALAAQKIRTAVIGGKNAQKLKNRLYLRVRATKLKPWIVRW